MLVPQSRASRAPFKAIARIACTAGLSAALVCGSVATVFPASAFAATEASESNLAQAKKQVEDASKTFEDSMSKVDELNEKIDDTTTEILRIEEEVLPEQRARAAEAASDLYKMQCDSPNIISMLMNSTSLEDFLTSTKYLTLIQDKHTDELNELKAVEDDLSAKMDDLHTALDDADAEKDKASAALEKAQTAADAAQSQVDSENAAEAKAIAEAAAALQAQSDAAKEAEQAASTSTEDERPGLTASKTESAEASTSTQKPSSSTGTSSDKTDNGTGNGQTQQKPVQDSEPEEQEPEQQQPSQPSDNSSNDSSDTSSAGGWMTGVASYYGIGDGFMGGMTASGDIVTETSMGVAMLNVPLGTKVEISYGGATVVAVVNDRGPYVHGRIMDLQPAVARALPGFVSAGVGTISYRIIG